MFYKNLCCFSCCNYCSSYFSGNCNKYLSKNLFYTKSVNIISSPYPSMSGLKGKAKKINLEKNIKIICEVIPINF